ncbi:hypothetical protein [Micropruina sp.]|uniref:pentapeptide repeat-containing protein n=1 Tax=Micropruina sp. TaxID=2737536 RepID=UPI00262CFE8A|nr:hypothetical protein [Micropruina sp.]
MTVEKPRVNPPQLPPLIGRELGPDADGASLSEARLSWHAEEASAVGATISDSRLVQLPGQRLAARRVRLAEVEVDDPVTITWDAPRSEWRGVVVSGGSIGVLDASGARWNNVLLSGVRIGYLNLREAVVSDVQLTGCRIGTLDLAGANVTRSALAECLVEDLDLHNRKGEHLDLRGLDMVRLNRLDGVDGMAGAIITDEQAHGLGPTLAQALRIRIAEEDL